MFRKRTLFITVIISTAISWIHAQTTTVGQFNLTSYENALIIINNLEFSTGMIFQRDYDLAIKYSNSTIAYDYPYKDFISQIQEIKIRIGNYGATTIPFTISATCKTREVYCDFTTLARILTVTKTLPSRANYGTTNLFALVFTQTVLSSVQLPNNLYSVGDTVFIDFPISSFPEGYKDSSASDTTYDTSFWNNVNTIVMPWIPFFTHCTNYDKRIVFFDVLENNPDGCNYIPPEKTKPLRDIPISGFETVADSCNVKYTCYHPNKTSSIGTPWYSNTGDTTLYYIYRNPISIEDAVARTSDQADPFFANLLSSNNDNLIPVIFRNLDSDTTGVPTNVKFEITYFQVNENYKQIISIYASMSDYIQIEDTDSGKEAVPYSLNIVYTPADYFAMINSFKAGIIVYIFVFILVSLSLSLLTYIFWKGNKLVFLAKKKILPTLKFKGTFNVTFVPESLGTLYASIVSILIFTFLLYFVTDFINFDQFSTNIAQATPTIVGVQAQRGRIGLICFFFSMMILRKGAALISPNPTKDEAKIIEENMAKEEEPTEEDFDNSRHSLSARSEKSQVKDTEELGFLSTYLQPENDKNNKNEDEKRQDEIRKGEEKRARVSQILINHARKQHHFILMCVFTAIILLFVIRPAVSGNSSVSSTYLVVGLLFADVGGIVIMKQYLLREILLLAPITITFEMVQLIVMMRAETFTKFILFYVLRMIVILVFRVYFDPILKNFEEYSDQFKFWITTIPRLKMFHKIYNKAEAERKRIEREELWKNIEIIMNKTNENKDVLTLEYIVFTLINFTTKQTARLMFPFFLLFNYAFPNECQITSLYGVGQSQLGYYIFFWIFLLIPSFFMDIFVFNTLEIVHGHKLFDYLDYCSYRFKHRLNKWIASTKRMDRSLTPEHRSIHNFCFSKQFYFTAVIGSWGIIFFMTSIYILVVNQYPPFGDAAAIPIFFLIIGMYMLFSYIFSKLGGFVDLWKMPEKKNDQVIKKIDDQKKHYETAKEISRIENTDLFRQFFIKNNKPWIIKNLKDFITVENFFENEGYLIGLYQKLVDEDAKIKNEKMRLEEIQKKQHENKDKINGGDFNDGADQDEAENYAPTDQVVRIKKSAVKPMTFLMYHWYYFARQNLFLKYLVKDLIQSKLKQFCDKCSQEFTLKVVPKIRTAEMVSRFRIKEAGLPFNQSSWISFYDKNQKFATLCDECEKINLKKKRKKAAIRAAGVKDIKKFMEENDSPTKEANNKKEKSKLPGKLSYVLLIWMSIARSRLMHKIKTPHIETLTHKIRHNKKRKTESPVKYPSPTSSIPGSRNSSPPPRERGKLKSAAVKTVIF